MNNRLLWQRRIRNYAGLLGALLPWLSLFSAWLYGAVSGGLTSSFWSDFSISATYYCSPALPGILTAASIVLMCYDGYSKIDNVVTTVSGLFGLMIVLFPCKCSLSTAYVGFFQLPENVSSAIHCTAAVIFFCLLAFNSLFLFTMSQGQKTEKKKLRNKIYIICGIGMLCAMILMPLRIKFPAKTWWVEMIALSFFGISWLTKGGAFKFLNDNE